MDEKNTAIRRANRKAAPKFILLTVVSVLIGGVIGYCGARFGLGQVTDAFQQGARFFCRYAAPWLLVACLVVFFAACVPPYLSCARAVRAWDGEDEALPQQVDMRLSGALTLSGVLTVAAYFLSSACIAPLLSGQSKHHTPLVGIAAFVLFLVCQTVFRQKVVDLNKRLAPEKEGSVYDLDFHKKWLGSCDEAERALIGQCAYKAHHALSVAFPVLWVIFTLTGMFLDTGILPSLAVCILWGISTGVYSHWAKKLSAPSGSAS